MVVNFYGYTDAFPPLLYFEAVFHAYSMAKWAEAAECDRELHGPSWHETHPSVRSGEETTGIWSSLGRLWKSQVFSTSQRLSVQSALLSSP